MIQRAIGSKGLAAYVLACATGITLYFQWPFPESGRCSSAPCSLRGVTLTIRRFNAKHFGIEDLIRIGTITEGLADILETAVVNRQNILISGGTSTCGTLAISLC